MLAPGDLRPPAGAAPDSGPQRRLRAAAFLSSFDRFSIPPLLVPIHRDLDVSLGAAAAVASAYFVAYGLSQPLWGALSERIGRAAVMRLAVAGGALSCLAAAAAQDLALLVAARVLAGLFFAALVPAAITYIGDTVRVLERQHALALLMMFSTGAIACTTVFAGVAAELLSWRAAFLVSAALAGGLAVALRGLPEPPRHGARPPLAAQLRTIAGRGWVRVVVALAFVEGAVIFGALTFVAASLQQRGIGAALAGSAAAGFGVANVLCTPLVTRAIVRGSSPVLVTGGAGLAAAGLLVAAVDATVLTAVLATVALGAGFGFLHSTMQLWATQVCPQARALTVSLFASAIFTGGAAASAVAAPLADDGRFSAIFLAAAAGAAVLAVVGGLLRARYVAAEHPPAMRTADDASAAL